MKKITIVTITTILLLIILTGIVTFAIINRETLNAYIKGQNVYTEAEIKEIADTNYQNGIKSKEQYELMIEELNSRIDELIQQHEELNQLNNEIKNEIEELSSQFEENDLIPVIFLVNNEIFNTILVEKDCYISFNERPSDSAYYYFVGWSLDGENVIDLSTYEITEETIFYAVFDDHYFITFELTEMIDEYKYYNTDEIYEEIASAQLTFIISEDSINNTQNYSNAYAAYFYIFELVLQDGETYTLSDPETFDILGTRFIFDPDSRTCDFIYFHNHLHGGSFPIGQSDEGLGFSFCAGNTGDSWPSNTEEGLIISLSCEKSDGTDMNRGFSFNLYFKQTNWV